MKTEEIARRLVSLCREQKWETALKELFAQDARSIEPHATPGFDQETKGLPAMLEKSKKFVGMVEKVHSISVSDPVVGGEAFACSMTMDLSMKGQGRTNMSEVCVYQVKDGKITAERFFY